MLRVPGWTAKFPRSESKSSISTRNIPSSCSRAFSAWQSGGSGLSHGRFGGGRGGRGLVVVHAGHIGNFRPMAPSAAFAAFATAAAHPATYPVADRGSSSRNLAVKEEAEPPHGDWALAAHGGPPGQASSGGRCLGAAGQAEEPRKGSGMPGKWAGSAVGRDIGNEGRGMRRHPREGKVAGRTAFRQWKKAHLSGRFFVFPDTAMYNAWIKALRPRWVELVSRAQRGEVLRSESLIISYQHRVAGFIYAMICWKKRLGRGDIAQQVFIKDDPRIGPPSGTRPARIVAFFRLARNTCIDHLRRQKLRRIFFLWPRARGSPEPPGAVDTEEFGRLVRHALDQIRPQDSGPVGPGSGGQKPRRKSAIILKTKALLP